MKISITYQYMNIIINDEQISTITIHRTNKDIKLTNGEIIKVDNWDMSSKKKYDKVNKIFIKIFKFINCIWYNKSKNYFK